MKIGDYIAYVITDDGERLHADLIEKIAPRKYRFTLSEGKKREIRRMVKFVNAQVRRLKRIQIGSYVLPANLLEGDFRLLTSEEVDLLQKNVK